MLGIFVAPLAHEEHAVMPVTAIDILVKKGRLELPVAVAIAEAIQMITRNEQLVTLPVLDSHLERSRPRSA
jgi:hypothetical protein